MKRKTKEANLLEPIQPFDSLPENGVKRWMFNPPKEISNELSLSGIKGIVPVIFVLEVKRPGDSGLRTFHARIAYSHGWWCVGKEYSEKRYNIYFTPTGCVVFNGSLGECTRRMVLLPKYPEGAPIDPPMDIDEWYASEQVMKSSQRWEEISKVLFEVKEFAL